MKKFVVAALLLATSPALAQQQLPTALDRVSVSLGQCVGNVEQRVDQIVDLQKQLATAQARIRELEPKSDPEKK